MTDTLGEQIIFEEGNVKITNLRAIIGSKTYAMSNVTSVGLGRQNPSRFFPVTLIVVGGLYALFGQNGWSSLVGGGLIVVWGFLVLRSAKPTFIVKIGSASGEMKALSSQDKAHMRRIVDAVNEAIVRRG